VSGQLRVPRHLAVVPDGNRRWARARGLTAAEGHRSGIANVGRVAEAAWTAGVETFTFWWGSPANLQLREEAEIESILGCLGNWLARDGAALLRRVGAAFQVHGRWREICPEIEPALQAAQAASGPWPRTLVLLLAYDGRDEIRDAARRLRGGGPDDEAFGRALWTGALPPVDLVVRTGGEPHLSAGFLLWQIAEAQLEFSQLLWPDYSADALRETLARHAATERRFGR
jgi:undecaprenyl diphosphate synthase